MNKKMMGYQRLRLRKSYIKIFIITLVLQIGRFVN